MRENVSEAGELSLADPEMLMSIKSVVMRRDILPGTRSGGIKKLKRDFALYVCRTFGDGHPNELHEDYLIHDTITKIVVGI